MLVLMVLACGCRDAGPGIVDAAPDARELRTGYVYLGVCAPGSGRWDAFAEYGAEPPLWGGLQETLPGGQVCDQSLGQVERPGDTAPGKMIRATRDSRVHVEWPKDAAKPAPEMSIVPRGRSVRLVQVEAIYRPTSDNDMGPRPWWGRIRF